MGQPAEDLSPIPWRTTAAVAWLAAAPWIVGLARAVISWESPADVVLAVMICVVGFVVSFPWWMAMLVDARPARPIVASIAYAVAVGAPIAVVAVGVVIWGSPTTEIVAGLSTAWLVLAAIGVGVYWLITTVVPPLRAWQGRGFVGRLWQRESNRWWDAAITVTVIGGVFAPVLLLIDPFVGGAVFVLVIGANLLGWVVSVRGVDNGVLMWEVALSLPAMAVATFTRGPSVPLVMLLGVAAAVALPAITVPSPRPGQPAVAKV